MRNSLSHFLCQKSDTADGTKLVFITADLGFSVLEPLALKLGKRFLNVGVAEALMASMAAAFAQSGFKVFTYSITPFATFRCLEQIRNDICYHDLDVTIVGVGAGYAYGYNGPTHHATEDLAAMWALPNMTVYSPADLNEATDCFERAWTSKGPKYLRLGKGGEGRLTAPSHIYPESGLREYFEGSHLTMIGSGNIVSELIKARQALFLTGIQAQVLSCPILKPFPGRDLVKAIQCSAVLAVEELNPYGGFNSRLALEILSQDPHQHRHFAFLSAADTFAKVVGDSAHLRSVSKIDANAISSAAQKLIHQD